MPRDPYEVLGVAKSATTDEITKAYKKLARKHHPDRNPGDKQAEATFKEIQNAYDLLNDPAKRTQFDQYGFVDPAAGPGPGGFPGFGGGGNVDPAQAEELFRTIFQGRGGRSGGPTGFEDIFGAGGGGRGRRPRQPQPEDVEVEANVPFLTAATGGSLTLRVDGKELTVKIPAGIDDGKTLRLAGQGTYGGAINVIVRVMPHAFFRREGNDIVLDVPIAVTEALLGGKVEVPTVSGKRIEVKIRPGTSSGARSRLPGFGINGGDQYLLFKIVVPKGEVEATAKKAIEEYAAAVTFAPRAEVGW